jgi:hypothetical protein
MIGGWSRQMPAACPPLSQRSTPLPLVDFLGQPERPGSLLGRRIEGLRAIGGGGGTPEMRKMRGVHLEKRPGKNIEISNYVTSPPSETPRDLADFHQRQGHAPRFAEKDRKLRLGYAGMGRYEGRSAGRLRASSQGIRTPWQGGAMTPRKLIICGAISRGDFVEWAGCTTKPRGIAGRAVSFSTSLFVRCA